MPTDVKLCPKCMGQKLVSFPPWAPSGVDPTTSSVGPWPCGICNGVGVLVISTNEGVGALFQCRIHYMSPATYQTPQPQPQPQGEPTDAD